MEERGGVIAWSCTVMVLVQIGTTEQHMLGKLLGLPEIASNKNESFPQLNS